MEIPGFSHVSLRVTSQVVGRAPWRCVAWSLRLSRPIWKTPWANGERRQNKPDTRYEISNHNKCFFLHSFCPMFHLKFIILLRSLSFIYPVSISFLSDLSNWFAKKNRLSDLSSPKSSQVPSPVRWDQGDFRHGGSGSYVLKWKLEMLLPEMLLKICVTVLTVLCTCSNPLDNWNA